MRIAAERTEGGLKYSTDQFRAGGERTLWIDGRTHEITMRVVADIRAKGFKCWRTRDQVWVREADGVAMVAANVDDGY
jgi:hypothetical protein